MPKLEAPVPIRTKLLTKGHDPIDGVWSYRYCPVTAIELGPNEIHEQAFWITTSYDSGANVGEDYDLHLDHAPKGSLTAA